MHPELEELLDYNDGRGGDAGRRKLERHLAKCHTCREEAERLREASRPDDRSPVEPVAPTIAGIGRWAARRREQDPRARVVKSQVAIAIGPYLGERGSHTLLAGVSEEGRNLLQTIEPVLAEFLGRRASNRLIGHVVERAIMRI